MESLENINDATRLSVDQLINEENNLGALGTLLEEDADVDICSAVQKVRIRPAMDSGAVANVINPKELPDDAIIRPNTTGKHFRGANDSVIEYYGDVDTILESDDGAVGCGYKAAEVIRPLHAVSQVCGPAGGPEKAKQDVMFNNDVCVVMPPGLVRELLKKFKPIAQYGREGNLYVGDMIMSSFPRQGLEP